MAAAVLTTEDWFKAIRCSKYPQVTKYIHEFKGQKCSMSWTALMWAAKFGDTRMVELLCEHEHSMYNENKETALMIACRFRNYHAANILVKYEAGLQDNLGWTALMWLSVMGGLETARLLLTKEARKQDKDGQTALMLSVDKGHYDIATMLLDYEARMAMKNGITALMKASISGNHDMVSKLAPYELGMQDAKGRSALMHAVLKKNTWLFSVLGVESSLVDVDKNTAFSLARSENIDSQHLLHLLLTDRYIEDQRRNLWFFVLFLYYRTNYLKLLFSDTQTIHAINDLRESFLTLLVDDLDLTQNIFSRANARSSENDASAAKTDVDPTDSLESFVEPLLNRSLGAIEALSNNMDMQPCAVCLDFMCEMVFLPCKHCIMCYHCTEVIKSRCPYCREDIKSMIQLDYAFESQLRSPT